MGVFIAKHELATLTSPNYRTPSSPCAKLPYPVLLSHQHPLPEALYCFQRACLLLYAQMSRYWSLESKAPSDVKLPGCSVETGKWRHVQESLDYSLKLK